MFVFSNKICAQLDTAFWFVAPEVAQTHGDRPIVFRFASLENPATISISQPSNPSFPEQIINLSANDSESIDLTTWIDIIENKPADQILNFGFKISATAKITAYYEVTPTCNCNPDIFALKGQNALGTHFITPFQNLLDNASYARSGFNIVATQNNTTITITPTQNIVGHAANVPFSITLNKGQTYFAQATSTSANLHLSGSSIISDKPISITLSDDSLAGTPFGGCRDLMGDQLIPLSIIGEEYIAIKGYLNGPDRIYVLSTNNGTTVSVDGVDQGVLLNNGETFVHTLSNPTSYIVTNQPSYVLHMSGFGCEVGQAILPPIICTGSNLVPFVRSTNEFFALNILVPSGAEGGFSLNGNNGIIDGSEFNPVPGTGGLWLFAQLDMTSEIILGQASRIENTLDKFHVGLFHGGATSGCRYAYFSDFSTMSYEINALETVCSGDTLELNTNILPGATYNWSGPNGFSAQGVNISIPNMQNSNSGQYIIEGNFPNECELISDTILIEVTQTPGTPEIFNNGPICTGEEAIFTINGFPEAVITYDLGIGTNTVILIDGSADLTVPNTSSNITLTLSEINNGGCSSEINEIASVIVSPLETPSFDQLGPYCLGNSPGVLSEVSLDGISGTWEPSSINTSDIGLNSYVFTPDSGQCADMVTMEVEVLELPVISLSDELIDCNDNIAGAQIGMNTGAGNSYLWTPSTGLSSNIISDPIASPTVSTSYTLTVIDSLGCSSEESVNVIVDNTPPDVSIINNSESATLTCTQLEINLTATGAESYSWDNGLGNDTSLIVSTPGIFTVTGTATNGCTSTAQIEILQDNSVDSFITLAQNEICSGESIEISVNSLNATEFNWTVTQNGVTGANSGTAPNIIGANISEVLTVTGVLDGTVDYIIEPILGSCVGLAQTVTITVLAPDVPVFDQLGPFCINDELTVLPSNSLEGTSGTWSPSTINTTILGTSSYIFTPNPGQCAVSQTMDILINDLPVVSLSGENLVGCAPQTVVLTSTNTQCIWTISNGVVIEGSEIILDLTSPGCYDVTIDVNENGCSNSLNMPDYICLESDPFAEFTASTDVFTDSYTTVSFNNNSSGASSFIWDFGDGNMSTLTNPTNVFENTEEGALITLTAVSDFGCTDEAQLIIEYDEQEIFYIPNTFTPDGDTYNQVFKPIFYSGFDPFSFEMSIFNRWGELIFGTNNAETGWDGSYGLSGMKAPDGNYSWKITYKNLKNNEKKVIVGLVNLLR